MWKKRPTLVFFSWIWLTLQLPNIVCFPSWHWQSFFFSNIFKLYEFFLIRVSITSGCFSQQFINKRRISCSNLKMRNMCGKLFDFLWLFTIIHAAGLIGAQIDGDRWPSVSIMTRYIFTGDHEPGSNEICPDDISKILFGFDNFRWFRVNLATTIWLNVRGL